MHQNTSLYAEDLLNGGAEFLARGDEAAVFCKELALHLEAVERGEVERQHGAVGEDEEPLEVLPDHGLLRARAERVLHRQHALREGERRRAERLGIPPVEEIAAHERIHAAVAVFPAEPCKIFRVIERLRPPARPSRARAP